VLLSHAHTLSLSKVFDKICGMKSSREENGRAELGLQCSTMGVLDGCNEFDGWILWLGLCHILDHRTRVTTLDGGGSSAVEARSTVGISGSCSRVLLAGHSLQLRVS
jgi:hypothetical protein